MKGLLIVCIATLAILLACSSSPSDTQGEDFGSATSPSDSSTPILDNNPSSKDRIVFTGYVTETVGTDPAFSTTLLIPQLFIVDEDGGNFRQFTDEPGGAYAPSASFDGSAITFIRRNGLNVGIVDANGTNPTIVTLEPGIFPSRAAISPDGSRVAVTGIKQGSKGSRLFVANVDGSEMVRIPDATSRPYLPSSSEDEPLVGESVWLPDGSWLAWEDLGVNGVFSIHVGRSDGTTVIPLNTGRWKHPSWSPDGKRFAYVTTEGKTNSDHEIFIGEFDVNSLPPDYDNSDVQSLRTKTAPTNITNRDDATDWLPAWSPRGDKIAFISNRDGEWGVYVVDIETLSADKVATIEVPESDSQGATMFKPTWVPGTPVEIPPSPTPAPTVVTVSAPTPSVTATFIAPTRTATLVPSTATRTPLPPPSPTATPTHMSTATPTEVPPTATPSAVATATPTPVSPAIIVFEGTGSQVTDAFDLKAGIAIFAMEHDGNSDFVVRILDNFGNEIEVLAEEIGEFSGSQVLGVEEAGRFILDVIADGNWKVTITPRPAATPTPTATLTPTATATSTPLPTATFTPTPIPFALLGPTQYLSEADSPFDLSNIGIDFFLENFEDGVLNAPGALASAGTVYGPGPGANSIDGDDGSIDGNGLNGRSLLSSRGASGIRFTFSSDVLGGLPTQVGIVWTDGAGLTTFEAFDGDGNSLGRIGPVAIADNDYYSGLTRDAHFFGVINPDGISEVWINNTDGGIEVDHLQYGKFLTGQ